MKTAVLRHNPGLSTEWKYNDQAKLEALLTKYASEPPFDRYAKISNSLRDKTIRDVALRCRWMTGKGIDPFSDSKDEISAKVSATGGPAGWVLEHNDQVLNQISANLAAGEINKNINLLQQARANIHWILHNVEEPAIMRRMPPLPNKLDEKLACLLLGQESQQNHP